MRLRASDPDPAFAACMMAAARSTTTVLLPPVAFLARSRLEARSASLAALFLACEEHYRNCRIPAKGWKWPGAT